MKNKSRKTFPYLPTGGPPRTVFKMPRREKGKFKKGGEKDLRRFPRCNNFLLSLISWLGTMKRGGAFPGVDALTEWRKKEETEKDKKEFKVCVPQSLLDGGDKIRKRKAKNGPGRH